MNNKEIASQYLGDMLTTEKEYPLISLMVDVGVSVNNSLPDTMLKMIAIYELSEFISQFQWKVTLGSVAVPTNIIGLVLAKSGAGKDSIRNQMEQSLELGYKIIGLERIRLYREKSIERATMNGEALPDTSYHQYLEKMPPLKNSISTVEGLVSRLNRFQTDGIGMSSVYTGELGSELQTNNNIIDNIRLVSELYDLGNKQSKAIKDIDRQDSEVKGMGMPALFVGSPQNLILDESILRKLRTEFVTKLARRAYVSYPEDSEYKTTTYSSFDEYQSLLTSNRESGTKAKLAIEDIVVDIGNFSVETNIRKVEMTESTNRKYEAYKLYCESFADDVFKFESHMLHRIHAHWRALKLAGMFAAADCSLFITE